MKGGDSVSHIHNIIDTDCRFTINPVARSISTRGDKFSVVQYDHDSERFTFQMPRYVEEHDMMECSRIEVHYTNITRNKKQSNSDVYIVNDLDRGNDLDTIFFSWLISRNATQLVGTLKFSITFICLDEDGNEIYKWSTDIFDGIQVLAKLENTESVVSKLPDAFEQIKQEIIKSIPSIDDTGKLVAVDGSLIIKDNTIDIGISSESGNALTKKSDGLYVGINSSSNYSAGLGLTLVDGTFSVKLADTTHGLVSVDGALALNLATQYSDGAMSKEDKAFIDELKGLNISSEYVTKDALQNVQDSIAQIEQSHSWSEM